MRESTREFGFRLAVVETDPEMGTAMGVQRRMENRYFGNIQVSMIAESEG